jgi:hypothetical protein
LNSKKNSKCRQGNWETWRKSSSSLCLVGFRLPKRQEMVPSIYPRLVRRNRRTVPTTKDKEILGKERGR